MYCSLIGCFNMHLKNTPNSAVKLFFSDPRKLGIQKLFFRHARLEWNDGKWRMIVRRPTALLLCILTFSPWHRPIKTGQNMLDVCVLWFIWPRTNVSLSFTLMLYLFYISNLEFLTHQPIAALTCNAELRSLTGIGWITGQNSRGDGLRLTVTMWDEFGSDGNGRRIHSIFLCPYSS